MIRIGDNSAVIVAGGDRSFPKLDGLYVPQVPDPQHWDDYLNELVPDAEAQLLSMLRISSSESELLTDEIDGLAPLVDRARVEVCLDLRPHLSRTIPTKALCSPEDHARLIDCIERYGVIERFGNSRRKYFYFEERTSFSHMGEPQSKDQEKWPNVINRTWVDVRRHTANVEHVWIAEEVELQMRLWEIQLEKSPDRRKSEMTP